LIGFVGRLDPVKGPQFFVEAARLCLGKKPSLKFILVGEGSLRKELEEEVRSWGLKDKIVFAGWRENIADIMSILDALVVPSLNEAVGIVLIEAQSLGIPVIASNVGGIPETMQDNLTGILVKPADPENLARAITGLIGDPGKLRSMSEAAKNWARDRFMAEKMVERISAIYQEVLKEKNVD
jgi:glycosyltransferase involved in cell wall biosynthesis